MNGGTTSLTADSNAEGAHSHIAAHRVSVATCLLILFTSLYALLGRGTLFSSDEGGTFNTAASLALRGSLEIGPYENVHRGKDGRFYSLREILPSLLTVPCVQAGAILDRWPALGAPPVASVGKERDGTNWPLFLAVTFLGPLVAAATLVGLYNFVTLEGGSRRSALLLAIVAGLCTPLAVYAKSIFAQLFESFLLMQAILLARRWRAHPSAGGAMRIGLYVGLLLMTRSAFVASMPCFVGYLWLAGDADRRTRLKSLAAFFVPVILGGLLTCVVNWIKWGSPFDSGYHSSHERFFMAPWVGLAGLLLSPGKGLFVFAPVVLVAWIYWRRIMQKGMAEFALVCAITATYLVIYSSWWDWVGGASWGPRFLVPLIAPWTALLGRALNDSANQRAWRALKIAAGIGFAVQCLGVCVAPHWMTTHDAHPFELEKLYLVQSVRFLWQQGPNDLWLWSPEPTTSVAFGALCLLLFGLAISSALMLLVHATHTSERKLVYAVVTLLVVLLSGVIVKRTESPSTWATRPATANTTQ